MATRRGRTPVPRKNCEAFHLCGKTLSIRSKHTKCTNCRTRSKVYKERLKTEGIEWILDQLKATRLREQRLLPFAGEKIIEVPKARAVVRKVA